MRWVIPVVLLASAANSRPLVPDAPVMRLDEIGIYNVGYRYRDGRQGQFPVGWSGNFDDATGVACMPAGTQNGKQAFLIHCPWRNGTGVSYQTFTFRLPRVRRILLRGATAMRADIVGQSDGATFRIYVNGRKLLDENRTDSAWRPFQFDLTPLAGQTAAIRFETDPGPKDNPSFDFSLWGDRELVLEGFHPQAAAHPAPPPLGIRTVVATGKSQVEPSDAYAGIGRLRTGRVKREGDTVVFHYSDRDGTMAYRWQRPTKPGDPPFGRILLRARMTGDGPVEAPLALNAGIQWTGNAEAVSSQWVQVSGGYICRRTYQVAGRPVVLDVSGRLLGKSLTLSVSCNRPVVRMLDAGGWGPVMRRRPIVTPYYSGQIQYLPAENLFVNTILDWTTSRATSQEGSRASYGALTDGRINLLNETAIYTAAWHLDEVLPNPPNPPSQFRKQIAGRIVLDNWGGRFTDIAHNLERLKDYGIDNCIVLVHDWQRSGYDNALPAHVPAQAGLGGDPGMTTLVQTGVRLGYLMVLHENYVDYYPNYDFFNPDDIAQDSQGNRQLAWYNPGTKIQSFAEKPNAIMRLAATQSPIIHERYGTNADYLDVHSAVPPWFHVDMRATEQGAGEFRRVWDVHRELWNYERKTHGGPVFGEGANHWYWSGCLDGVEAQFGVGWPGSQGLTAPLAVDFDLLKIHPLQFNHGMGYYERWWSNSAWGTVPPMEILDRYRMQEVAYGHAGFLAGSTYANIPLAWLEHHLMAPVTARYGAARPTAIAYQVDGRWTDSTAAAKAGAWDRVRVTYDSGLTITANNARTPLMADGVTLPQFGWLAKGGGVTAWTALRGGVIADYSETADSVFANARAAADYLSTDVRRVRPEVGEFHQTGPRQFQATYKWIVNDPLGRNYHCFVHFVRSTPLDPEGIRFQQDHALPVPTAEWKAGTTVADGPYTITVPPDIRDGDYEWTIGLYEQGGGARATLEGVDDGHGRIRLGVLHVAGDEVRFTPEKGAGQDRLALYRAHVNGSNKPVDFSTVRTDGSVLIRRESGEWVLRPLARDRDFLVEISSARFAMPALIRCVGGTSATVTPVRRGPRWRLPLTGAKEYRWR